MPIKKGDRLVFSTAGAGGQGDPLTREPERTAADVHSGLVSVEAAAAEYGVVVSADGEIDAGATERVREKMRSERDEPPEFDFGPVPSMEKLSEQIAEERAQLRCPARRTVRGRLKTRERNMAHTLAEKILLAHAEVDDLSPGDIVMVRVDTVMANDVSGPVAFRQMEKMGASRVFDPSRVVMVADHFVPAKDARSAALQKRLKDWARDQGVAFYDQGRGGIEHMLLAEDGLDRARRGDRRRRLAHVHLRGARRVRERAGVHRHRRRPGPRRVLAAGAGDDPGAL